MVDEGLPADPFRESQGDWTSFAAGDAAFFAAHVAAGMPEGASLELTKEYMRFMLQVILANQAMQQQAETPREQD